MLAFLLSLSLSARAGDVATADGVGVGVVLGEPTGLTLALRPNMDHAVQSHLSYSVVHDYARVSVDYLNNVALLNSTGGGLTVPLYIGIGGVVSMDSDPALGARVPLGLSGFFGRAPIEMFGEVAPVVLLMPSTAVTVEGALGLRAYF